MRVLSALLARDLGLLLGSGRGGPWLPVLFFVAVAVLFPFAVGPDAPLLARTGGGVLWIAALLAAILPIDRLIAPDLEAGFFDQFALRGISEDLVLAVRLMAHWLSFGPLLLVAALPAAAQSRNKSMPGYDQWAEMSPKIAGSVRSGAIAPTWAADSASFDYTLEGVRWRFDVATLKAGRVEDAPGEPALALAHQRSAQIEQIANLIGALLAHGQGFYAFFLLHFIYPECSNRGVGQIGLVEQFDEWSVATQTGNQWVFAGKRNACVDDFYHHIHMRHDFRNFFAGLVHVAGEPINC